MKRKWSEHANDLARRKLGRLRTFADAHHLRGAVPCLHETYGPQGKAGAATATGEPDREAGLRIFFLQKIEKLP